jgi:hypothetical protein
VALVAVCTTALLVIAGLLFGPKWREFKRRRVLATPFPAAWRAILRRNVSI